MKADPVGVATGNHYIDGDHACAEGAIAAGCRFFAGYPITPSTEVAERIGVPDDVIAASMVAFGTSLPELMTAIAAIRKGHPEITVGNVVGADVLNCLFVIGAAACAKPLAVPANFFYFHFIFYCSQSVQLTILLILTQLL